MTSTSRFGATKVVALDGPSGAGKSTVAARLARRLAALTGARVPVLAMDDLYPGWDGLAASVPLLVEGVLRPLTAGRPGAYRRWDWAGSVPGALVEVPVVPLLLVEGAGCGSRAARPHLAAVVWVEAPAALRRERGLVRDGEAYRPHWERWAKQERELFAVEDTRGDAQVVLHTG